MSIAVVTVAAGGLPVVDVTATTPKLGLPVTEATNGIPVTKVTLPKGGLPVTFVAASGVPASISGTLTTTEAQDSAALVGTVVEAFSGPGDAVPGMVAAWGTHAFDAAAIGPNAQTVVRASDSAAQSFTPLSNGANNKASITTFLTATTGKTSVLFDQVGALDATQTTAGNRPAVTLSGPNSVLTTTFTRASSHFLNCGNSSALNPTTGMSFSMWVSIPSSGGSNEYWAIGRDDNTLGRSYCFGRTGDLWTISVNGGIAVTFTKVLAANTLMHFAGTGDAATGWRMYIDGVLVGVSVWSSPNVSTANTNIGRRSYAGFEGYWDGTIDDVIIDNRAWSAPEVFSLYTKGKVFFDPAFVPTHPAAAVGYNTLVLFDDFNNTSSIDMANSKTPGFNWYLTHWFTSGGVSHTPNNFSVAGSVLTIGGGTSAWPHLVSAFDTGLDTFTGTVYNGGGYFEMRMKFDPSLYTTSDPTNYGVPNFYAMSIEHIADPASTSGGKWPGQASGYAHFIEVDIFEPNNAVTSSYFSVTHDWGGIAAPPGSGNYPINITNGGNNVIHIGEMDFTKFHTYGCLWVPQVGATPGRLQRFFDGALVQSLYFLGPPGSPPLPNTGGSFTPETAAAADRTYSVIDTNRLALLIGSGTNWPMQVDWVKVWKGAPTGFAAKLDGSGTEVNDGSSQPIIVDVP